MPEAPEPLRSYSGRFALTATAADQKENVSGRFALAVHRKGITLDLVSPLGNTLARVQTENGAATLTAPQADGTLRTVHGSSAEALAEQILGWTLPVSGLPAWIEGRPVDDRPSMVEPQGGGPAQTIYQDGWTIRILDRFEGSTVPRLLDIQRPAAGAAPAVQLRTVVEAPG